MTATRLSVVSPYGPGAATTRARALEWALHLDLDVDVLDYAGSSANRPIELVRNPLRYMSAERRTRRAQPRGPLLLLREASPFSRGGVEERLLTRASPGVYDLDDALYADLRQLPDPAALFPKAQKAIRAARAARRVIVGNEVLADWASGHNRDVVVVPTCVQPSDYRPRLQHDLGPVPVIGWIGSPSTESYLADIAAALLAVHASTGAVLRVISAGDEDLSTLEPMVERVTWSSDSWQDSLATFDVGIGPLPDTEFARGKCAYKLLQYAAAGVPFVASPVGANADAITRLSGLPASSTAQWTDALNDLLAAPPAQRTERAERGRAGVQEHYSFDTWAPTWRAAVLGG